ncbi:MAG: TlpA disulfide reductase family protein [bacterium]
MIRKILLPAICILVASAPVRAAAPEYAADYKALLSKLQSMGHGSFPETAWRDVLTRIDAISTAAEQAGDLDQAVEANLIKAMVYGDMQHDYAAALAVLEDLKTRFGASRAPAMKKVYVKEADIYGKLGDEAAVRGVINEFKASAHYDAEDYPFSGGQGRDVPLKLVRPSSTAADSLSVTAMEVARTQSRFAPGNYFPEFNVIDSGGVVRERADYAGKVLFVDFWLRDWTPWKRDLKTLVSTYARYRDAGFDVLGFCLERDPADLPGFLTRSGMSWPQIVNESTLSAQLGIFGEASNFLLDRNGAIIGRDLHGADLVEAVKAALGSQ